MNTPNPVENPAVPVTAEVVVTSHQTNPRAGFKLLLGGNGLAVFYAGCFLFNPALILGGAAIAAASVYSLRRSGESLVSGLIAGGTEFWDVGMDIIGGMDGAVTTGWKMARLSATDLAARTGQLTTMELEAVTNSLSSGIIYDPAHILELVFGRADGRGNNTITLATSGSGKTTFLQGCIHQILERPGKKIVIVCDPNFGASNDGKFNRWAGLPHYKGNGSPIGRSCLVTNVGDIKLAIRALGELYHQRMNQAQIHGQKDIGTPLDFAPVYLIADEFQTTLNQMTPQELEDANAVVGGLVRAKKYKIFFTPIMHDDTAENSLKTNQTAGLNLMLLGGIIDRLESANEVSNNRYKFKGYQPMVDGHRARLTQQFGKAVAKYMLGVIHLKDAFTCSDGTTFEPGCHTLRLPDYRALAELVHDFEPLPAPADRAMTISKAPKLTLVPRSAGVSIPAAVQTLSIEAPPPPLEWDNDGNPSAHIQGVFRAWVIQNYAAIATQDSWNKTKFFQLCKTNGLGQGRQNQGNAVYVMVCALADAMGGQIIPSQLLAFIDGENP
jgi:hypothetical protein